MAFHFWSIHNDKGPVLEKSTPEIPPARHKIQTAKTLPEFRKSLAGSKNRRLWACTKKGGGESMGVYPTEAVRRVQTAEPCGTNPYGVGFLFPCKKEAVLWVFVQGCGMIYDFSGGAWLLWRKGLLKTKAEKRSARWETMAVCGGDGAMARWRCSWSSGRDPRRCWYRQCGLIWGWTRTGRSLLLMQYRMSRHRDVSRTSHFHSAPYPTLNVTAHSHGYGEMSSWQKYPSHAQFLPLPVSTQWTQRNPRRRWQKRPV